MPDSDTRASPGDTLIVYGTDDAVVRLAQRRADAGHAEHLAAVARHGERGRSEREADERQDLTDEQRRA